ncbi:metallophosphoesterase [Phenylobacterium sp. J367]|uniref:metallophosphoesterase n=1 Tax=Phenylobacterium sp. J367 TaxID=2898435 RepID=UPI00215186CF|nr:metallophosphoesterase [Phenylobacterium sp. J367]MCR5880606.1 metallophosphoesterase [Phenylobacterium sp. J367]
MPLAVHAWNSAWATISGRTRWTSALLEGSPGSKGLFGVPHLHPRSPPVQGHAPTLRRMPGAPTDLPTALRRVRADLAEACGPRPSVPAPRHTPAQVEILTPGARAPRRRRAARRRPDAPADTAGQLVYAVGDVHGRYDLLLELLARLSADSAGQAAGRQPVLVLLGDYIDRGPDSARVLEALVTLEAPETPETGGGWRVVALKGNHEQALLRFLDAPQAGGAWLRFGGAATLAAYGVAPPAADATAAELVRARRDLLAAMPASHLRRLQTLDLMAVVGDYAFVHAGVAPGVALEDQREADLLWIREEFLEAERGGAGRGGPGQAGAGPSGGFTPSGHVIVHGHTWTGPRVARTPHRIGLDTGAHETGVLSAVRLAGTAVEVLQVGAVPLPEPACDPPAASAAGAPAAWRPGRPADRLHPRPGLRLGARGPGPGGAAARSHPHHSNRATRRNAGPSAAPSHTSRQQLWGAHQRRPPTARSGVTGQRPLPAAAENSKVGPTPGRWPQATPTP